MLERLQEIMARLRDPFHGCAWDREQTARSIAPYTIEEAYEVADAIERDDMTDLQDELGDLQLQVVYLARIAEERGAFTLDNVLSGICDKMVRRHPHLFGDGAYKSWDAIKAEERAARPGRQDRSALADVAHALPALSRADKIQRRAALAGFDWPDASGPREKVFEEIAEIDAAPAGQRAEEIGDLLFSVVNWARHLNIDAETALRDASNKFERRLRDMEALAEGTFGHLTLAEKEEYWRRVK